MISKQEFKSLKKVKEMLDSARKTETDVQAEIAVIDEKYRKLAEKEKGKLTEQLTSAQNIVKLWENSTVSIYGKSVEELLSEYENKSTTKDDDLPDDEKVVDTTSEPEVDGAGFIAEDNTAPEETIPVEETKTDEFEDALFPGDKPAEAEPDAGDDWETTAEARANNEAEFPLTPEECVPAEEVEEKKDEEEAVVDEEEGWPEFPEEF